ncbi:translation initiation factor IF-2-like [Canis lupus dingo]|uniref:translation initiation factor IF-2-like n=1 Tax=Canis lupus dingo TaxID=286419 RepID=UPI0020C3F0DA|nr:translation initiation factor IF-2-like [Canis lupus dingo]
MKHLLAQSGAPPPPAPGPYSHPAVPLFCSEDPRDGKPRAAHGATQKRRRSSPGLLHPKIRTPTGPPKGVWEWGWGRGAVTSAAAALGPQLEPRRPSPRAASSSGPENEGRGGTAGGSAATNASPGARPGRAHVLRPDRLPRGRDAGSKKTQARGPTGSRVQEPLLSRPCAAPPSVAKGRGRAALPVNEAAAPAEGRVAVRPHDPPP